ncbi:condensation domain-containing protein [Streptomyces sp. NPDC091280]|uniref:condensation domain-containing protein n=1 Tax=Streptomyces sp. NPDC091280 TaxID=3365984 RepID=UPI003822BA5F
MKLTDIPSLDMPPGRPTVWRATATTAWAPDPRPASYVQQAHMDHVLASAGAGPLAPSWLGIAFDLPPHLDQRAFAAALAAWTDRHENLRSRLVPPGTRRETLPPGATAVHGTTLQPFTDGRQLAQQIEELFDREAGPLHWPGFVCVTVDRADTTTVYLAADHSLMDGYSVFLVPQEIHALYTGSSPLPETASYLDFAAEERATVDALTADDPLLVPWRKFLAAVDGQLPEFPTPIKHLGASPPDQPSGCRHLLDAPGTRAFDRACRSRGGDSFTGLLACLARIGYETTGEPQFSTMAPFHTRTTPYRSSLGWYVGMAPISFPLHDVGSFERTLRSAVAGLEGVKEMARVPVGRITELLGTPLRDPFMISYMDLRLTPGAREWTARRTVSLRGRSNDADEVYFWFMRTHEGLTVSWRHPATDTGHAAVDRYIGRLRQVVEQISDAGEWQTPTTQ